MQLAVDRETGFTVVTEDTAAPLQDGLTVFISLPGDSFGYGSLATETARLAGFGRAYQEPTSPHWYGPRDLLDLMQQAPEETTVADVADWFGIDDLPDERLARELDQPAAAQLLSTLRLCVSLVQPARLGEVGENAYLKTFYQQGQRIHPRRDSDPLRLRSVGNMPPIRATRCRLCPCEVAAESHSRQLIRVNPRFFGGPP
jgi:hypothetical protein